MLGGRVAMSVKDSVSPVKATTSSSRVTRFRVKSGVNLWIEGDKIMIKVESLYIISILTLCSNARLSLCMTNLTFKMRGFTLY